MKHAQLGLLLVLLLWLSAAQPGTAGQKVSKRSAVPKIAIIAGFHVGYDTIEEMEGRFGHAYEYSGGHPGGAREWRTRPFLGAIDADGFNYRSDGRRVIDSLSVSLFGNIKHGPKILLMEGHLQKSVWMSMVSLGMTKDQVLIALRGKLPPPKVSEDTLIWKVHKIVRINDNQYDNEHDWTSQLSFVGGRLDTISVSVD